MKKLTNQKNLEEKKLNDMSKTNKSIKNEDESKIDGSKKTTKSDL